MPALRFDVFCSARLALLLAGAVLAGVGTAGCGGEVPRTPWLDLTAALPLAEIHLERGDEGEPQVRSAGDALYLPFGSRVSYYAVPPAGSALLFDAVEVRGGGELRVSAALEGEPAAVLAALGSRGRSVVEVPGGGARALRLTLEAVASGGDSGGGRGLVLRHPLLAVPAVARLAPSDRSTAEPRPVEEAQAAPRPRRLNVILYLIDTLRADHLGCYGYPRPVSPAIDAFAAEGVLFANAVAQSSWTRSSVASLFTGLWPGTHGVHGRRDRLAPEAVTLAEILHDYGWETAGFVTNRNVARAFGLAQGFETYRMLRHDDSSEEVHRRAAAWLEDWRRQGAEAPFFLYLHTVEPHSAYRPPEPFRGRFAPEVPDDGTGTRWWLKQLKRGEIPVTKEILGHLQDLYDAEIAANDASFGKLTALLEETGLAEETVVILVSDHGEEFHEHGRWEHGKSLHTEVLDVPLLLRVPGPEGERLWGLRVAAPVQHTDVLPTLLALLGVPVPEGLEGENLLPLLERERGEMGAAAPGEPRQVYSHLDLDGFEAAAVTTGAWRLIDGRSELFGRGLELYERREDPAELTDLAERRPVTAGWLRTGLRARELAGGPALTRGEAEIDEETRDQLRALGYLD
jgi:arylsulfatase A-like enzyme